MAVLYKKFKSEKILEIVKDDQKRIEELHEEVKHDKLKRKWDIEPKSVKEDDPDASLAKVLKVEEPKKAKKKSKPKPAQQEPELALEDKVEEPKGEENA